MKAITLSPMGTKLRQMSHLVDTKPTLNSVTYFVRVGDWVVGYANDYTMASALEGNALVSEMRKGDGRNSQQAA